MWLWQPIGGAVLLGTVALTITAADTLALSDAAVTQLYTYDTQTAADTLALTDSVELNLAAVGAAGTGKAQRLWIGLKVA